MMDLNNDEQDQIFRQLKKQKSVQISDKTEIVEIREKHGPLYKAIPRMPVSVAVLCCVLNILVPGLGTFISAFTVLCGAPTGLTKVPAFFFNILSAFLQTVTFIVIVGWVWSILWGMNMVSLATVSVGCIFSELGRRQEDSILLPETE